jgi:hypothetical protein
MARHLHETFKPEFPAKTFEKAWQLFSPASATRQHSGCTAAVSSSTTNHHRAAATAGHTCLTGGDPSQQVVQQLTLFMMVGHTKCKN